MSISDLEFMKYRERNQDFTTPLPPYEVPASFLQEIQFYYITNFPTLFFSFACYNNPLIFTVKIKETEGWNTIIQLKFSMVYSIKKHIHKILE
jgi:hypothetical protein